MTRYLLYTLICSCTLYISCFPVIEQKNPVAVDVGELELGYYHNQYFGYSLKVPDNWQFFAPQELYPDSPRYSIQGVIVIDSVDEKAQLIKLGGIIKQTHLQDDFFPNLQMQANHVGDFDLSEEQSLAEYIFSTYQEDFPGFSLEQAFRKPINGRFYYIWEGHSQIADSAFSQTFYLLLTKDKTYSLSFVLSYRDEVDKGILDNMIAQSTWRFRD